MSRPKKSAVFLCKCGPNIADFVDLEEVAGWAEKIDGVEMIETHNLFCSPDGMNAFREMLKGKSIDNVIVAACSPKMHEKTFQNLAGETGINMSRVQIANIREHCAWVTKDKTEATTKARALISAALCRAEHAEELEHRTMKVNTDILIIGGGVSGMEAALTAAQAGRKVYIVDREVSLGGTVIKTEEVAPNMECSPCMLAPRLSLVKDNPDIEVITNAEVTDILGFYGNFTAKIRKKARYVKDNCIGCEVCFAVCPVEIDSPFHLGMGKWKAVHTLFPGSVPAAAVIDRDACRHFVDQSCDECRKVCPFESIDFEQKDEDVEISVGAIVVATGFDQDDMSAYPRLGYGRIDNVFTLSEFERMASSNGPCSGEVRLKNGEKPGAVAVVHCAGSLMDDGIPYCSGICCLSAVKTGVLMRAQNPDVKVYNIHNDLVLDGPDRSRFFSKAKKEGTVFIKCRDTGTVSVSENNGRISVTADGLEPVDVDMVVLANGMRPSVGTRELAEMLNVEVDQDGFFKADHDMLNSTGASVDGIHLAGCAAGPCDIATSITRGRAAVGDAISRLMPGREIELEIMTACIDSEVCAGCKLCISVCPYKAITYDSEKQVCSVNEAICHGCGTCAATCASGAARAKHFTDEQIYAEIRGLFVS